MAAALFVCVGADVADDELLARVRQNFGEIPQCRIVRRAPLHSSTATCSSVDSAIHEALRQLPIPLDWELIRTLPKSATTYYLSQTTAALDLGEGPLRSTRRLVVTLVARGEQLPQFEMQLGPLGEPVAREPANYDAEAHQLLLERAWGEAAEYKTLSERQQKKIAELELQLQEQRPFQGRQLEHCGRAGEAAREPNPYNSGTNSSRSSSHLRSLDSSISPSPEQVEVDCAISADTTKPPNSSLNLEERIRLAQIEAKRIVEQTAARHVHEARSRYRTSV